MTVGVHPAITFDASLKVGQVVEAGFTDNNRPLRFPARIVALGENIAWVGSLEDGVNGRPKGHEFVIQRFSSPRCSNNNGLFPARQQDVPLEYGKYLK